MLASFVTQTMKTKRKQRNVKWITTFWKQQQSQVTMDDYELFPIGALRK